MVLNAQGNQPNPSAVLHKENSVPDSSFPASRKFEGGLKDLKEHSLKFTES